MADRRYQERFQDFQAAPSSSVWEGIEEQLDQRQKQLQRQAYGFSSALLLLLSGFFLGILYEDWHSGSTYTHKSAPKQFVLADSLTEPINAESKGWFQGTRKMLNTGRIALSNGQQTNPELSPKVATSQSDQSNSNNSASSLSSQESKATTSAIEEEERLSKQKILAFRDNLPDADQNSNSIPVEPDLGFDQNFEKASSSWSLGIRAEIAWQKPNYQVKRPYNPVIKKQLEQANGPAKVFSSVAVAHYQLSDHWRLTSGIGVEVVRRSFTYRPNSAFKRNPDPGNDEDDEANLTANNIRSAEKQTTTNTSGYIKMPLSLQYGFSFKRFKLGLEGGITVRKLVNASGKQLNPLAQRVSDRSSNNSNLRTWQSNVVLRPSVGYQLTPNWQVTVAPQASVAMESYYQENYPISNRPYRIGIQAGINYNF